MPDAEDKGEGIVPVFRSKPLIPKLRSTSKLCNTFMR